MKLRCSVGGGDRGGGVGSSFSHQITALDSKRVRGGKAKPGNSEISGGDEHQKTRDAEAVMTSIIFLRQHSRICHDGWGYMGVKCLQTAPSI